MEWKLCDDDGMLGCNCNGHQTRLFQKIKRGTFSFHEKYWDPISDGAKDLIARYFFCAVRRFFFFFAAIV